MVMPIHLSQYTVPNTYFTGYAKRFMISLFSEESSKSEEMLVEIDRLFLSQKTMRLSI